MLRRGVFPVTRTTGDTTGDTDEEPTVNVKFCLAFPREAVSVPVMRRVLGDTLRNLGIADECVGDILVAVTEACTNVLRHGGAARRYDVVASVGPSGCLVEVVDPGQGFGALAAAAGAHANGRPGAPGPRSRRARPTQDGAPSESARAKVAVRGQQQAQQHHGQAATPTARPCARLPQVDDQVIARLPESGRGLQIMRALVDDVTMLSGPGRGTVVSMRKRVSWRSDAPLAGLSDQGLRDAG
jgi:anti-sigma regulatory factor (Ser/Thr protein kinase)